MVTKSNEGILKGNAAVGQSGGPTAAINATLSGVLRGIFTNENIYKVYGMIHGIEGLLNGHIKPLNEVFRNEEEFQLLETTPSAILGSCRLKLPEINENENEKNDEVYEKLFNNIKANNIRYFFYIGGNDSMDTVNKMSRYAEKIGYEMRIVGVPKTIDNDLAGTDHSPGFGSAAKYIATTMQEIYRDNSVYSLNSVVITEIMGRDAGWLTASAALPRLHGDGSPDLLYLPEVVFDVDKFIDDINNVLSVKPNVLVAVSEGVRDKNGVYLCEYGKKTANDIFGNKQLSGTADVLCGIVKERIGCKVRPIELNTPQRCAAHLSSLCDVEESVMIGKSAVEYAVGGKTGVMMTFNRLSTQPYRVEVSCENVEKIANVSRDVPLSFITEEKNNVTTDCLKYLLPLIMGEPKLLFQNGIPVHFHFDKSMQEQNN